MSPDFSTAILLIGPPGVGKSTWIKEFQRLNPDIANKVISSDAKADQYAEQDGTDYAAAFAAHSKEIFNEVNQDIASAKASGEGFIIDQTNPNKESRKAKLQGAENWLKVGVRFVVDGPEDEALLQERLAGREERTGKHINPDILRNIRDALAKPEEQPGDEFDIVVHMNMQGKIIRRDIYSELGREGLDQLTFPGGQTKDIPTHYLPKDTMTHSPSEPIIVNVDFETDGANIAKNSLLSIGASVTLPDGEVKKFYKNVQLQEGKIPDPSNDEWWHRPEQAEPLAALSDPAPVPIADAWQEFDAWLKEIPGEKVLAAYPLGYEKTIVDLVYLDVLKTSPKDAPFGDRGIDIRSYAAGVLGVEYSQSGKDQWSEAWKEGAPPATHQALEDTLSQGYMLDKMMEWREARELQPDQQSSNAPLSTKQPIVCIGIQTVSGDDVFKEPWKNIGAVAKYPDGTTKEFTVDIEQQGEARQDFRRNPAHEEAWAKLSDWLSKEVPVNKEKPGRSILAAEKLGVTKTIVDAMYMGPEKEEGGPEKGEKSVGPMDKAHPFGINGVDLSSYAAGVGVTPSELGIEKTNPQASGLEQAKAQLAAMDALTKHRGSHKLQEVEQVKDRAESLTSGKSTAEPVVVAATGPAATLAASAEASKTLGKPPQDQGFVRG